MQYRQLAPHEIVQEGDLYFSNSLKGYDKAGEPAHTDYIGSPASRLAPLGIWKRPIKDNWISFKDRSPTQYDATPGEYIVVRDKDRTSFRNWDSIYDGDEYWMPLNFVPRTPEYVKVDGRDVVPQKDGSVKVGCATIPKKDMLEIFNQYNRAVEGK